MTQPLLCSIADVKARAAVSISDPALTALVTAISDEIEDYCGAWLAPRPALTLLFDVEQTGCLLRMRLANRALNLRTLSALGTAVVGQPESGGVYTTVPLASALVRPRATDDVQANSIVLVAPYVFTKGFNTVQATGDFGPAAVPPKVQEIAIQLALYGLSNNQNLSAESGTQWSLAYAGDTARANIFSGLDDLAFLPV
jgi:hypothetical protein